MIKNIIIAFLSIVSIILIYEWDISQQYSVFPMWWIVYLIRNKIQKEVDKIPLKFSFILVAVFFGLLTEFFAILNNINTPYGERILLHQNFFIDFMFALVYYPYFMIIYYFIIRKYRFSKLAVFSIFWLFWVMTEEVGQVFVRLIMNFDIVYAIVVFFVYGIFAHLGYFFTKHKFDKLDRIKPGFKSYVLIFFVLLFTYLFYWLFIYNTMMSIVWE